MSAARDIPPRKVPLAVAVSTSTGSASCSSPSSLGSSVGTPALASSSSKGKQRVSEASGSSPSMASSPLALSSSPSSSRWSGSYLLPRRSSLLGCSLAESVHTVVNLSHADGPPRLVTCVKSSQGFDWNQELFLPSYTDYGHHDLEHRPDPVEDIILTDEEAAAILPQ